MGLKQKKLPKRKALHRFSTNLLQKAGNTTIANIYFCLLTIKKQTELIKFYLLLISFL